MKYKHIIWDFDGTLFDTYGEIAKVIEEVLKNRGIVENLDWIAKNLHMSLTHTLEYLSKKHNLNHGEFKGTFMQAEERMNVKEALPFPGVKEIIDSTEGYTFMVTNRAESVFRFLEYRDYRKYFKEILHRNSGFPLKPGSEAVEYLIEKYGLDRKEMLFIGDRDVDIECAINAQIHSCYYDSHNIPNIASCTYYTKDYFKLLDILKTA